MIRLIILFLIFITGLHAYVHGGWGLLDDEPAIGLTIAGDYEPTFNDQVGEWSEEINKSTAPVKVLGEESGNCLPVAVELQKRIVATGRSALIVAVSLETQKSGHALVLYTSEPGGRFDYVIDNGHSTGWVAQPRALLDNGAFGEYYATCKDPIPEEGYCQRLGLPF